MELKADKDNPAEQRLLEVFNEQASASLKARVADGKKTIRGALAYITDYARKKYAKGGTAVMDSDEIIGQFFHYLEEDELDFEGKAPCAKVAATPNFPAHGAKPKKKEDPHPQLSFADALFSAGRPEPAPADPAPVPDGAHARKLPPKKDDCETTPDYWDCECDPGASGFAHVHHKSEDRCPTCGARREDQAAMAVRCANDARERLHRTPGMTIRVAVLRKSARYGVEVAIAASRRDEAKIVAAWHPGAKGFRFREISFLGMSGWCTDWDVSRWDAEFARTGERPYRPTNGYWMRDCWLSSDSDAFVKWDGRKTCLAWTEGVANPELLAETPFRYCGWRPGCGCNLLEVLHDYAEDRNVEHLVKAGVFQHTRSRLKRRAIATNPALRRIIAKDPALVRDADWCDLLWCAADPRRTPADARARTDERKRQEDFFHPTRFQFPAGLDRGEAFRYCNVRGIDAGHYTEAMTVAVQNGLDVRSRSVAFPNDWEAFFAARMQERDRKVAAENRNTDALVAKFVADLKAALDRAKPDMEGYEVVWMTRQIDFVHEGDRMGNCIGGGIYSRRMGERRCVCLVLCGKDERVDVEIDVGSDWRVRQCYARQNHAPTTAASRVAARVARSLQKHYAAAA